MLTHQSTLHLCWRSSHFHLTLLTFARLAVMHVIAPVAAGQATSVNLTPLKRELCKISPMAAMFRFQGAALDEVAMGITLKCINASGSNQQLAKVVDLKNRIVPARARILLIATLDSQVGPGQWFLGRRRIVRIPGFFDHFFASVSVWIWSSKFEVVGLRKEKLLFTLSSRSFSFFFNVLLSGVLRVEKRVFLYGVYLGFERRHLASALSLEGQSNMHSRRTPP